MNYGKLTNQTDEIRWVQSDTFHFDFIKENDGITEITPGESFLEGTDLHGKHIYLYMSQAFQMHIGVAHFNTDIVVYGNDVAGEKLSGLRFTGGVLGLLFMPDRLDIDMTAENGFQIKTKSDLISQEAEIGGKRYTISICSSLLEHHSVSGSALSNDRVVLEVTTADGIGMDEIVPLYNGVCRMCQFLTFRKNVRFDEVELLTEEQYDDGTYYSSLARLYARDGFKTITEKKYFQCIPIESVKTSLGELFKAVFEERENKPHFSLDFLPEDDNDARWISSEKIRSICTALECEAMLQKLTAPENPDFQALIRDVKKIVDTHKKGENPLPDKTYDMINGSISHWDFAAADKVKALFDKYMEIVIQGKHFDQSIAKFESGIDRIIRYRNRVTHGNYMSVTTEDATIAVNLMNLIYISRLDRLGVDRSVIKELISRGVVY